MYFIQNDKSLKKNNKLKRINHKKVIKMRKNRDTVFNMFSVFKVKAGDVLVIVYWIKGIMYSFEGLCISLKKKNFKLPDVTFILRNVILGIGVELTISYFYNRLFNFRISDYKRKSLNYKRTKLFFVRNKLNRASRIKS